MPSEASGVRKDGDGSERIVAVDDVANKRSRTVRLGTSNAVEGGVKGQDSRQVHDGLAALVLWNRQGRRGVVDDVNAVRPVGKVLPDPGGVFVLHAGDNDIDSMQRVEWR